MKDLIIYGAGGLGREVAMLIEQINDASDQWNIVGFCDDGKRTDEQIDGYPVIGGVEDLRTYRKKVSVAIAIANGAIRQEIVRRIHGHPMMDFPVIVHPSAIMGTNRNTLKPGSIITAGCILTTGITVGEFAIINLSTVIGHDVRLGAFSSVMPRCSISGNVAIGDRCLIGTGASILQNLSIGSDSIVGAGAVVTKDIPAGSKVAGVPARPLKAK